MKNRFLVVVMLALSFITESWAEPIKIGVLLPLTGDFAFFGEQAKQGMELAVSEINKDSEKVKLIYEDEQCLPKSALNGFNKLTSLDKVDYVLGPACTGSIITIAESANRMKKYVLALLDTNRPVAKAGPYVYSLGYSSEEEAEIVAEYMKTKGIESVGIIYEEDAWAVNVKDAFRKRFESLSGKVVGEEAQVIQNANSAPNYRPIILKLSSKKPQALYVVPAYNGGNFLKQIRSMGNKLPVFGPDTFAITEVIDIAGKDAEGVVCANAIVNETSEQAIKLKNTLKERFKSESSSVFYPALGYDGLKILYQAASSGEDFPVAMSKVKYSSGVINVDGFNEEGMSSLKAGVFQIKGQKLERVLE
jgi:branched-chain amino acid transport system substrate-binding protein